jgi:peroxiredoxin
VRRLVGLLSLLLVVVACAGTTRAVPIWERPGLYGAVRPEMGAPQPGDAAPDFELPDGKGGTFRSTSLRGAWVVLHFTASWCPFCDAEVEHLGKLASEYAPRGVKVVLVDVKEDEPRWTEYSQAHLSPAVIALRDATGEVAKQYAPPHAQPSFTDRASVVLDCTLILDPSGTIRLFLMPDSKHFDPTFQAVRGELDRSMGESTVDAVVPAPVEEPPILAPEAVVRIEAAPVVIAAAKGEAVLTLHVAPGYHLMSDRPSAPEYIATTVHLDDAAGIAWGAPSYPTPSSFSLATKTIATFQGDVLVHVPLTIAAGTSPGERVVTGTLRYQSCTASRCLFPATRALQLSVRIVAKGE